ncbi:MFS transporter [Ectobacillus ponti]|uniref:MFS transporter n=1 Tax=Ectobacillus ponti TaxID=2961894 RepID=A0AA41X5G4_9BACI|nr:MFS transporter [Ectobacillus ponti]MCP8969276.1 MFS transporter [Ectobacillus ponti]
MKSARLWTRNFVSVSASSFFLFLAFYYLLVVLPIYSIQSLHGRESEAGLIVTVFLVAAILVRPLAGRWMERFGTHRVFLLSLVIFAGMASLYTLPSSMAGLLLLRFLQGIGFGMATTAAGSIVAAIVPDSRRGEGMGYYAMSMNLAMVLGPFLGLTALHKWGGGVMFLLSFLFAAGALAAAFLIRVPEQSSVRPAAKASILEMSALRISLIAAVFALVYASILSFVSVYAKKIGLESVSSYFFVVYAAVLLLSRPFTGRLYDRYGANSIVYPAFFCFAAGMLLLSQAEAAAGFLTAAGLIGLGWGTLFPSFQTIAIQGASPARRGAATATFLSIFDFGIGIGSFLVGLLAVHVSFRSLYGYSAIIIAAGAVMYGVLQAQANRSKRNLQKKQAS